MKPEILRNILYHHIGNEFCKVVLRLVVRQKQGAAIGEITTALKEVEETLVERILNDPQIKRLLDK